MACGIGVGARGFNIARPRVGNIRGRFECAGGIDVDAGAIRNFERMTGVKGTVMDLFALDQYIAFHGKAPPAGWVEATPADVRAAYGDGVDVAFASMPCKGFSGLLSATQSKTDKYQALNGLTLRGIWLLMEAYKDDPIPIVLFENVPRIATRGRWLLDQIIAILRSYGYSVNEDTHDCGVLGGLAQSRKRFLLIARHSIKVPPFVYQPEHKKLRGVGEVIGKLPLPGDPVAGTMHRIPALQWKTWVRLALVPAGKDWRALNDLRVEGGVLADYGIMPETPLRDGALGVNAWDGTAPTLTAQRAPGQGRFSVADPRTGHAYSGSLGVMGFEDTSGTIAGDTHPSNGKFAVADPRIEKDPHADHLGVHDWVDTVGVIGARNTPTNGAYSVADPRPAQENQTYQQFGVRDWSEPSGAVSGKSVHKWRTRLGLPSNDPHTHRDPAILASRMLFYQLGWSDSRIAREQRFGVSSILRWRKRRGLRENFRKDHNERWRPAPGIDSLVDRVRRAVGRFLPRDIVDDTVSDLCMAVLDGTIPLAEIERNARKYGNRTLDRYASKFGPRSLDEKLGEDDFTLMDTLVDDSASSWLEEMGATVW